MCTCALVYGCVSTHSLSLTLSLSLTHSFVVAPFLARALSLSLPLSLDLSLTSLPLGGRTELRATHPQAMGEKGYQAIIDPFYFVLPPDVDLEF